MLSVLDLGFSPKVRLFLLLSFCIMIPKYSKPLTVSASVLHGLFWSRVSMPDNAVLHVCSGDNVTLQWLLTTGYPEDEIVDIQWFYEGLSHEIMALVTNGQFVVLPSFSGRLQQLANAGLVLSHVTVSDSGNYSIEAVGGYLSSQQISRLHRTAVLEVTGRTFYRS